MSPLRSLYEGLPPRLSEALDEVLHGLSVEEAARHRDRSTNTIKAQRSDLYRRLRMSSQREVQAEALRLAMQAVRQQEQAQEQTQEVES